MTDQSNTDEQQNKNDYSKSPTDWKSSTPMQVQGSAERFAANAECIAAQAEAAMDRYDFETARAQWAILRECFPDDIRGYTQAAQACIELNSYDEAEILCVQGMKLFGDKPNCFNLYAEVAMRRQNFDEALLRWADFQEKFPNDVRGYSRAAWAYLYRGQDDEAEALSLKTMERFPDSPKSYNPYADAAMRRGDYEEALKRWATLREKFPEDIWGYVRAAEAYTLLEQHDAAEIMRREALKRFPDDIHVFVYFAKQAMQRCDFVEAMRNWKIVIEKFPMKSSKYAREFVQVCVETDGWPNAEAWCKKNMLNYPHIPDSWIAFAEIAMCRGDYPLALARWSLVRENFPHEMRGYIGAARACLNQGDTVQAKEFCRQAVKMYEAKAQLTLHSQTVQ